MFDLGWSEILVIAIIMIVVIGPKDLPRVLRSFGRTTARLRAMAGEFRRQFDEALREAELDDVKNLVDDVRKLDPRNEIRKHFSPIEQVGRDIKKEMDRTAQVMSSPEPSSATGAQPAEPLKQGPAELPGETPVAPAPESRAAEAAASQPAPGGSAGSATSGKAAAAEVAGTGGEAPAGPARKSPARKKAAAQAEGDKESKPRTASRSKKKTGSEAQ